MVERVKFWIRTMDNVTLMNFIRESLLSSYEVGIPLAENRDVSMGHYDWVQNSMQFHEIWMCDAYGCELICVQNGCRVRESYVVRQFQTDAIISMQRIRDTITTVPIVDEVRSGFPLIQLLLNARCGGMDKRLLTSDKPFIIHSKQYDVAKDLLLNRMACLNPVVYISPLHKDGSFALSYTELAKRLAGVAHVVVEGNRMDARRIRELTTNKNPFDGAIRVLFPFGKRTTFLPYTYQENLIDVICERVTDVVSMTYPGEKFSFARLKQVYLSEQRLTDTIQDIEMKKEESVGQTVDDELIQLYEDVLGEHERENTLLHSQLDDAKSEIYSLRAQLSLLQSQKQRQVVGCPIVLGSSENDLYDGERKDVVLKLIQKEYLALKDDNRTGKSRKVHVLSDILEQNACTGMDEEIKNVFSMITKDGTFSASDISKLEHWGFCVVPTHNKHYKILYQDDGRYQIGVSFTPSDHRAGDNLCTAYLNQLFGY